MIHTQITMGDRFFIELLHHSVPFGRSPSRPSPSSSHKFVTSPCWNSGWALDWVKGSFTWKHGVQDGSMMKHAHWRLPSCFPWNCFWKTEVLQSKSGLCICVPLGQLHLRFPCSLLSPPRWSQPSCCQEALQSFGCPPECAAGDPKRRLTQCAEVISFEDVWLYCIEILHRNSQDLVGLELITYIILYPSFILISVIWCKYFQAYILNLPFVIFEPVFVCNWRWSILPIPPSFLIDKYPHPP